MKFARFTVTIDTDTSEHMKDVQAVYRFRTISYVYTDKDPMKNTKPRGFYGTSITKQIDLEQWCKDGGCYNVKMIQYLDTNKPPTLVTPPLLETIDADLP